jgi:hypothetical protein
MTDSMNPYLAAMYNTNGAGEAAAEDLQKTAEAELFCKVAADHGIDLSAMSDEQISDMYSRIFVKTAEKDEHEDKESPEKEKKEEHEAKETPKEEKEEEAKKAEAAEYFTEKRAFAEKIAEGDYIGRVMAHSFTQERDNIETAKVAAFIEQAAAEGMTEEQIFEAVKEAAGTQVIEAAKKKGLRDLAGKAVSKVVGAAKDTSVGKALKYQGMKGRFEKSLDIAKHTAEGKDVTRLEKGIDKAKQLRNLHAGKAAIKGGIGVGAVGAAGAVHHFAKKDKEASAEAFEEMSANHAIKTAEAAGYDVEQAQSLVSAVYTLGLAESEKIASVQDVETATHVRGLEYLEAAGYPVNWEEVFGG